MVTNERMNYSNTKTRRKRQQQQQQHHSQSNLVQWARHLYCCDDRIRRMQYKTLKALDAIQNEWSSQHAAEKKKRKKKEEEKSHVIIRRNTHREWLHLAWIFIDEVHDAKEMGQKRERARERTRVRMEGERKRISCCCRSWLWGRFVSFLLDACQYGCLCHRFRFLLVRSFVCSLACVLCVHFDFVFRVRLSFSPCSHLFACVCAPVFERERESAYALCGWSPAIHIFNVVINDNLYSHLVLIMVPSHTQRFDCGCFAFFE